MPSVDRYMTREPYSVAPTETLQRARQLLISNGIRHLPVVDGDRLVGLLSDRDIELVATIPGMDLACVDVARVMTSPLGVWAHMPLDEVTELMASHKADCVVVRGGRGIVGIFTAVDAMQALSDFLRRATA